PRRSPRSRHEPKRKVLSVSIAPPLRRPAQPAPTQEAAVPVVLTGSGRSGIGNRLFAGVSTAAAITSVSVLAAVAAFLLARAWPALTSPAAVSSATAGT